ncbi:MAG: hypothetical protein ACO3ST_00245, partial [Burkholderiaceae bacterium]
MQPKLEGIAKAFEIAYQVDHGLACLGDREAVERCRHRDQALCRDLQATAERSLQGVGQQSRVGC